MGAFMIFDIGFGEAEDRAKFEEKYKIKKKQILVDEESNSYGFVSWSYTRNPFIDVIYYIGFMGYAEPEVVLKECLKENIKIKFMAWIPINDRNVGWTKIRGRW